jgi:hypothetical protein
MRTNISLHHPPTEMSQKKSQEATFTVEVFKVNNSCLTYYNKIGRLLIKYNNYAKVKGQRTKPEKIAVAGD